MDEEENELKRDKHLDVVAVVDDVDGGRIIFMFVMSYWLHSTDDFIFIYFR